LKNILSAALSLALAACATENIDKDYALSEPSGKGVVIGSIARSGTNGEFRLFYRQTDGDAQGYFAYGRGLGGQLPSFEKDDIKVPHLRGALFASELPAGDYELYSWAVDAGSIHTVPAAPFSVHFHVLPGKAVYLGAFVFQQNGHLLTGGSITLNCGDQRARDIPIFAAKYPNLAQVEIASSIEENRSYEDLGEGGATRIDIPAIIITR
jgi:hypothetical protein